jgi:hypothetical protein
MAASWIELSILILMCEEILALIPSGLHHQAVQVETRLGIIEGTRRSAQVGIEEGELALFNWKGFWERRAGSSSDSFQRNQLGQHAGRLAKLLTSPVFPSSGV